MSRRGASALCQGTRGSKGIDEGWTLWCKSAAIESCIFPPPVDRDISYRVFAIPRFANSQLRFCARQRVANATGRRLSEVSCNDYFGLYVVRRKTC